MTRSWSDVSPVRGLHCNTIQHVTIAHGSDPHAIYFEQTLTNLNCGGESGVSDHAMFRVWGYLVHDMTTPRQIAGRRDRQLPLYTEPHDSGHRPGLLVVPTAGFRQD